jgi:WD40 repeat protein
MRSEIEDIPLAQIWDIEKKECLKDIRPLLGTTIKLSKQGQWIACTRDKYLIISHWDGEKDLFWDAFGKCQERVAMTFSKDGNLLATNSSDTQKSLVQVWSMKSKQCLYKFEIRATDMDLSSNRLALGHLVHGATVIDLENGLVCSKASESGYSNIRISHDGGFLASFNLQEPIRIWDLSTITSVEDVDYHKTPVQLIALIADDNTLLSATSSDVKIWDITSQRCKETCPFSKVLPINKRSLASAKRAPYFAVEGDSGIEVWQIDPLGCNKTIEIEDYVSCLSISDDGQRLVVGCGASVKIWDLETFELKDTLPATSDVKTVIPWADGSQVAFATQQSIEVWKLPDTPLLKVSPNETQSILTLAMYNQTLMCYTRKLHIWDIETDKLLLQWQPKNDDETPILHESFFDYESVTDPVDPNQPILKPFYLTRHGDWVVKNGERVLWLPPEYRLDMGDSMAILTGSTIVLGSGSGRVLFLPFRH